MADNMSDVTLRLTTEEAKQLLGLLENSLKQSEIEEHRTDALSYKQFIKHNEELLRSMIKKLQAG